MRGYSQPGDCRYPLNSISRNSFWCCRHCATSMDTSPTFQLNNPTSLVCRECARPRWRSDGSTNSLEHLICRRGNCLQINLVSAGRCVNPGCLGVLPAGSRDSYKILANLHILLLSTVKESRWLCTLCHGISECRRRVCHYTPKICTGWRDVEGVWVIGPRLTSK